ncbi:MAG: penicillin acylase family protein [Actinobacteria bacterium]|nr:penicillin acylase family protein [Actinomycetota bacterium]
MPTAEIRRDRWGIPHVLAQDADALAFGQGAVTAQDRAWQLEVARRRSEGTLAAAIGADGTDWDVLARRIGVDALARRSYAGLSPATQRWVAAYVEGVNHARGTGLATAPELDALGVAFGPWQPWTPLGVLAVQHALFGAYPSKLWRRHVAATLGDEAVALLGRETPQTSGSNAWAVTGALTTTGGALVAGDPHRVIEAPGVYQQVHLVCTAPDDAFDVVGLAFPGVPGIQHFGHTGPAAWALTNAMADDQDLYVEHLRRDGDRVLVRDGDAWVEAPSHRERVEVRDGAHVEVEVVVTPRGPLVLGGPDDDGPDGRGAGLALRTPTRVLGDLGVEALPLLLRARTAADVEAAWSHWVEPVNSVLVADGAGSVRRIVAGRVPARAAENRTGPVPGDDPAAAWTGWEPLPTVDVAALGGFVSCANDRRPGDTEHLGSDFAPPHRARRITALLTRLLDGAGAGAGDTGGRVGPDDCARIHVDTRLGSFDVLRDLVSATAPASDAAAAVRERLLAFDGRMDAGSADAALLSAWRTALVRRLAADPALAPLHAPHGRPALYASWLDVPTKVGLALETLVLRGADLGLDVQAASAAALDDAAAVGGHRVWGDVHVLVPVHALRPGHPAAPVVPPAAVAGDIDCVLAASSVPGVSEACSRGPVARYVWDLADRSASRWVVPLGASGRWDSPHALDQLPVYAAGDLVTVVDDLGQTRSERVVTTG